MADSLADNQSTQRLSASNNWPQQCCPWLGALALAALLSWSAFAGAGGLSLAKTTHVWVGSVPLAAVLIAVAVVWRGFAQLNGWAVLVAVALFTLLVGASTAWSLTPDLTWLEFNRTFTYLFVLSAGVAAVRLWPRRWMALIFALLATVVVIVGYALLTKVAPAWLAQDEIFGRLRTPFSYWNALGLISAFGLPLCLWLGTAARFNRFINAAAYPILGLCMVALMLTISRGALAVAVVIAVLWFACPVPRMRGLVVLVAPAAAATGAVIWAFGQPALTEDNATLAARESAGVGLGLFLIGLIVVLFATGLAVDWIARNRPVTAWRQQQIGKSVLTLLALVPIVLVIALAFSSKGLSGSIDSAWHSVTNDQAQTPPNSPSRLTSASSVRARYWHEAFSIWQDHRYKGAGAGSYEVVRKRYRTSPVVVAHAHGQIPQQLADLGLAGVLLTVLAGVAWLITANRTLLLLPRPRAREEDWSPERQALLAVALVALAFGLHTAIDWTWYVPGIAFSALFAAGWIAGRGSYKDERGSNEPRGQVERYLRYCSASMVLAIAAFSAWSMLLPLRSDRENSRALQLARQRQFAQAKAAARKAHGLNPTTVNPYFTLSAIEKSAGDIEGGLNPLEQAVRLQPADPDAWFTLGNYLLFSLARPAEAASVLSRVVLLDPQNLGARYAYYQAQQAIAIKLKKERRPAKHKKKPSSQQ